MRSNHDPKPQKEKPKKPRRAKYVPIGMKWRLSPLVFISVPFIAKIFDFWSEYGFYNIAAICLTVTSCSYLILYYYFSNKRTSKKRWLIIIGIVVVALMITIGGVLWATKPYNYYKEYQNEAVGNGTSPSVFLGESRNATITQDQDLRNGAEIYSLFTLDPTFNGFLGLLYGLFSVLTMYIGSRCKVNKKTKDLAQTLISFLALLSVGASIMIFAASSPNFVYSVKHILAVMSLLLGVIFLALGFIIGPTKSWRDMFSLPQFIAGVVSFTLGFTFGGLLMPLTRAVYPFPKPPSTPTEYYYVVFPGVYFFASSAMIALAMLVYIIHLRIRVEAT